MPSLIQLCCLLLIVSFHDSVAAVDEDDFIYNGFAGSDLLLDGEAYVTQGGVLALTTSYTDILGHGFHPKALPFVSSDGTATSFSATFVFAITPSDSGYSGNGMAFVISLALLSDAWPGEYLGLSTPYEYTASANRFFAIELDTVANKELGDIDDNHVGIDLNNLASAGSSTAGYYSAKGNLKDFNPLRVSSGNPMQVWVDYFDDQVEVRLAPVPMNKPSSPLLTYDSLNLAKVLKNGTKSKAGVPTAA